MVTDTAELISELGVANSSAVVHSAGTVAMSRTASVGFSCILGTDMATSQDYVTWTCGPLLDNRFVLWALRAMPSTIQSLTMGSTHKTIYMPDIEQLAVPLPPVESQRTIADYLDAETARIDALVAKKRHLIDLLDEHLDGEVRDALLALDAPHLPLKRRWRVADCKHRTPQYVDDGYPVVSPGDTTPGRLDLSRAHRFVGEDDYRDLTEPPRRPSRGSIVYSRNASIGIASYVDTDEQFCMGQDVCLITSRNEDQLFLMYVLNTLGVDQLDEAKIGSTFNRVNIAQILEVRVPCPDPEVQTALATEFDRLFATRDAARSALHHQIDLLVERRQTLVTAAVTGGLNLSRSAA